MIEVQEVKTVGELRKLMETLDSSLPICYAEHPLALFQPLEVGEMRNAGDPYLVFFGGPQ